MTVYVTLFPEVLPNRSRHRSFRTVLIHELVQPLLDHKAENYVDPRQSNLQDTRLKGKHFAVSRHPERRCCTVCGYKKDGNGKQKRKKVSNYCEKCQKFICKDCFESYHVKSDPKKTY